MTEPLDTDYLMEFSREQQRNSKTGPFATVGTCPRCAPHEWHGRRCVSDGGWCTCSTSFVESA